MSDDWNGWSKEANERYAYLLEGAQERLMEADRFHAGIGKVHQALDELTRDLEGAGIDYAVLGGLALNAHGYRRETVDVDVLVTPGGLQTFTSRYVGSVYEPRREGARLSFRFRQTGVSVDFVVTGEFPGDKQPKPVAFPHPCEVRTLIDGKYFVTLASLLTIKLAAGKNNPNRLRDLADVQETIKHVSLDERMADELHPYVRDTFLDLLHAVQNDTSEVHGV